MEVFTTLHEQYPLGETLIVVALFLAGIWIVEHVLYKVVKRIGRNENNPLPSSSIFANIVRVCVWAIGLAWMFRTCFNYDVTGFVAALGIGGIAISLGFRTRCSTLSAVCRCQSGGWWNPASTSKCWVRKAA